MDSSADLGLDSLDHAQIIDSITGKEVNLVLRFDDGGGLRWYRCSRGGYLPTHVFAELFDTRDKDALEDALAEAESELILAIDLMPRYGLHADWFDPGKHKQSQVRRGSEYVTQEQLEATRIELFGTSDILGLEQDSDIGTSDSEPHGTE